jgi:GYF domain 2
MSNRSWFFAAGGQQQGPYPEDQFRGFVASGAITAETLVWTEGMSGWQRAGDIPGLLAGGQSPLGMPPSGAWPAGGMPTGQALKAEFGTWELFGRGLLVLIGDLLVIPSPWTKTSFYRWLVAHVHIPQRPDVAFSGEPGDIWYAFVLLALGIYAGVTHVPYLNFALVPVQAFLWWLIIRWFAANIRLDGQQNPVTFTGGVWPYIGWYLLAAISFFTIVGWPWVLIPWARWMCRHIEGTRRQLTFNTSGLELLWRSFLFIFAVVLIIPIPWAAAWYIRWSISQFALVERAA